MPFGLKPTPLEHLPGAPLRLAVIQVRYSVVLGIERPEEVSRFQELLGDDYELVGRETTAVVQVLIGDEAVEHPQPPRAETLWRFNHAEGAWTVALTPSALGFEATDYHHFDEFANEYRRVLDALATVFSPPKQRRLGVRYINEIHDARATGAKLDELVAAPLLAPIATELGRDLLTSLAEWRFQQPDGVFVLRHGLVGSETYVLDFDYFTEDPVDFEPLTIRERVADYHAVIESAFVWSLTKEYLEELRSGSEHDGH